MSNPLVKFITDTTYSVQKDGPNRFALLVASANSKPPSLHDIEALGKGVQLTVEYGDFAEPLKKASAALTEV